MNLWDVIKGHHGLINTKGHTEDPPLIPGRIAPRTYQNPLKNSKTRSFHLYVIYILLYPIILQSQDTPIHRFLTCYLQISVGFAEISPAKKPFHAERGLGWAPVMTICSFVCYKLGLGLCIGSPEDKHHGFLPLVEDFDDTVRKDLPSLPLWELACPLRTVSTVFKKQYPCFAQSAR